MYRVEIYDSETNKRLEILGTYPSCEEANVAGEAYINNLFSADERMYTEFAVVDLEAKYNSSFR